MNTNTMSQPKTINELNKQVAWGFRAETHDRTFNNSMVDGRTMEDLFNYQAVITANILMTPAIIRVLSQQN